MAKHHARASSHPAGHALLAALLSLAVLVWAPVAHAERAVLPEMPLRARRLQPEPASSEAAWLALRERRLSYWRARRREGITLLSWGALNGLAGALAAGVKHEDDAWLGASVTTLGFGAINALLALPLLDLTGARRQAILDTRAGSPAQLSALREREAAAQLKSGQVFALNAGLDVFYLATGAFLIALAQRETRHADWERGAGAAFMIQGAFLLGFDIACWIGANRRAEALRMQGASR